ncbi:hypothetical protein COBT_002025 [Conglomerata obtusa]
MKIVDISVCLLYILRIYMREVNFLTKAFKQLFLQNEASKFGEFNTYRKRNLTFKNIYLTTQDNVRIGCWYIAPYEINDQTRVVILCHGNGCNRKDFVERFRIHRLVICNYIVLAPDYRSFGDSEGEFWMDTVNYDIEAVHKYCISKLRMEPSFVGFSLGGAVVLEYLRYSRHDNKIVLISTFSCTLDIVSTVVLWKVFSFCLPFAKKEILEKFNYDSVENITYARKENVIIFHGDADDLVPFWQGKKLSEALNCTLIRMHDDTHFTHFQKNALFEKIDQFLRA